ncbi:MAG: trypsin-like peptidase domain-containing protein [Planctomycetota bacterium JB042]
MSSSFTLLSWVGLSLSALAPASERVAPASLVGAIREARERVFPTLVHLRPVFQRSFAGRKIEAQATGSGVIVTPDGLVVTNFHVAGTATRLLCTLSDRRRAHADLVGADAATDLAVVRLRLDELGVDALPHATFGDAGTLVEGEFVMAMGSPLGLTRSLSLGVVSCRERFLPPMTVGGHLATGLFNTWIQTDAAINPGNSGGPLVDLGGRIVGINTRGYRGADNLGFSIPADVVEEVLAELVEHGHVARSRIGVSIQPLQELVGVFTEGAPDGVLVASVEPGSPAAAAGVGAGDVLTRFDGEPLAAVFDEDVPGVRRRLAAAAAGVEVEVEVRRQGRTRTVRIVPEPWRDADEVDHELEALGLTVRRMSDAELRERYLEERGGVLVTGVRAGSRAASARPLLRPGDVVVETAGQEIAEPADLERAIGEAGEVAVLVRVVRAEAELLVAVPAPEKTAADGGSPRAAEEDR